MSDFKTRLDVERKELDERLGKLTLFLKSDDVMGISKDQRDLLNIQSQAMGTYLSVLKYRIELL
jgi:hypothetical protein